MFLLGISFFCVCGGDREFSYYLFEPLLQNQPIKSSYYLFEPLLQNQPIKIQLLIFLKLGLQNQPNKFSYYPCELLLQNQPINHQTTCHIFHFIEQHCCQTLPATSHCNSYFSSSFFSFFFSFCFFVCVRAFMPLCALFPGFTLNYSRHSLSNFLNH